MGNRKPLESIFVSSRIYTGNGKPFAGYIRVLGNKIADIGAGKPRNVLSTKAFSAGVTDAGDNMIIPGLIDLHIHGSGGYDVSSSDQGTFYSLGQYLAKTGTTSFLPTLGAMPADIIEDTIKRVRDHILNEKEMGASEEEWEKAQQDKAAFQKWGQDIAQAQILGLHLEGPFLNPLKKGAMREEYLIEPSIDLAIKWWELSANTLNRVTIAPELAGAREVAEFLSANGVTVAAGHTMADYEETMNSILWGVTVSNHTFNAMREFRHRDPGILGAVFTDPRLWAELLCDGIHVHPAAVLTVLAAKGVERVFLVSDALAAAGLPMGDYESLGHSIKVDRQGRAYLADGTLAGSTATLLDCLKNLVDWAQCPLEQILPVVTSNPAKAANVFSDKGSLEPGKDADFVCLNSGYDVVFTVARGNIAEKVGSKS